MTRRRKLSGVSPRRLPEVDHRPRQAVVLQKRTVRPSERWIADYERLADGTDWPCVNGHHIYFWPC
jgi:hypothetical protein